VFENVTRACFPGGKGCKVNRKSFPVNILSPEGRDARKGCEEGMRGRDAHHVRSSQPFVGIGVCGGRCGEGGEGVDGRDRGVLSPCPGFFQSWRTIVFELLLL
jgi:hypothetical protein